MKMFKASLTQLRKKWSEPKNEMSVLRILLMMIAVCAAIPTKTGV